MSKTLDQLGKSAQQPGWRGTFARVLGSMYAVAVIGLCVIFIGTLVLLAWGCAATL